MKKYLTMFSLILFLLAGDFAMAFPLLSKNPKKCPSVSAIRSQGIGGILQIGEYWLSVTGPIKYNTSYQWLFFYDGIYSGSEYEVYKEAAKGLNSLRFISGPDLNKDDWVCTYKTDKGYTGETRWLNY